MFYLFSHQSWHVIIIFLGDFYFFSFLAKHLLHVLIFNVHKLKMFRANLNLHKCTHSYNIQFETVAYYETAQEKPET